MTSNSTLRYSKSNPSPEISADQAVLNACNFFRGQMVNGVCRAPAPGKGSSNRSLVILPNPNLSGNIGIHLHNDPDGVTACLALKKELATKGMISGFKPRHGHAGISKSVCTETQVQIDAHASRMAAKVLKRIERARVVWGASTPLSGTVAHQYLQNRAIWFPVWPESLRCHPDLPYWANGVILFRSAAMVGLITNVLTGKPQGVHLTYLDSQGQKHPSAPNGLVRKMIGLSKNGCVRLDAGSDFAPRYRGRCRGS